MILVHATTVDIHGQGVLIRGPSGSGKSDLALRLLDGGARLVADDQTEVSRQGDQLIARSPDSIAGLLEVRGLGIVKVDYSPWVALALVVDLVADNKIERLPEPGSEQFFGISLPCLDLAGFQVSAAAKVRLAVFSAKRDIMLS